MKQWYAKWIMFEECPENVTPVFRREFILETMPGKAEIQITGLGFYLLEINGMRVGDELLQPAFTVYDKTVLYNSYDIREYLAEGKNEIRVTLGNGWFHEPGEDCFDFEHAVWKSHLQMICELYLDGTLFLKSDTKWQCREGKWSYNSVRFGENYDAGITEKEWKNATIAKGPGGILKKQRLPGIRIQQYLSPICNKNGVYDFGRNIAGDAEITVEGKRGGEVEIKYGERLDANGEVDQTLIKRHPEIPRNQTDYFRKGTDSVEIWHPEFSYKGFRYVQIKGNITIKNIRARIFYTDLSQNGGFQCSHKTLQQIYDAALWSVKTNFHHIPTDCPHREKNGWTGDAHISSEFALFNLNMEEAYIQYIDNLVDCQWPSGQLPCIAPTSVYGYNYQSGPTWDAALIFIPWNLYFFTGRKEILERYYDSMRQYMYYTQQISEGGICKSGLGDFLPDCLQEVCPREMILSCFVLRLAQIMEKIAKILKREECEDWRNLSLRIKKTIKKEFYNKCSRTESYLSCVLYYDLSDNPEKEAAELAALVRAKKHCAGGGIFGSVYVLEVLTRYGYFEDALQIVMQEKYPGWAYMLKSGGSTLWEHWDGEKGSLNHHMRSAVGAWIYKALTGLEIDESSPGWRRVVFRPRFTHKIPKLTAWFNTPYGKLSIFIDNGKMKLEMPEEVTAHLFWKNEVYEITGSWERKLY